MAHQVEGVNGGHVPPPRSVAEIQVDIEQTRQRLVESLGTLKQETAPKAIVGKAKARVTSTFVDEQGNLRRERVAAVAGVVVGLLVLRRGARNRRARIRREELAQVVWVPVPRQAVSAELVPMARNAKELAPPVEGYLPAIGAGG